MPSPSAASIPSLGELISRAWSILRTEDLKKLTLIIVLGILGSLLEIIGIGLIFPLVVILSQPDSILENDKIAAAYHYLGSPSYPAFVVLVLGILIGVFIFKNAVLFFSNYYRIKTIHRFQSKLAAEIMGGFLSSTYSYHIKTSSSRLVSKITGEIPVLVQQVVVPILWIINEIVLIIGLSAIALCIDPIGSLIVLAGLGVAMTVYYNIFKHKVEAWGEKVKQHNEEKYQTMQHSFEGIKELIVFGKERYFTKKFTQHENKRCDYSIRYDFLGGSSRLMVETIIIIIMLGAIILMIKAGNSMDNIVAMLAFYAATAFRLMPTTGRILDSFNSLRFGARALVAIQPDIKRFRNQDVRLLFPKRPLNQSLELKNVAFTYDGSAQPVLDGANLLVAKGSMIGLQGSSGVGKTTLVDVIMGLLPPNAGQVLVDGESIQDNLRGWQKNIGYVPQSVFILDDTLCRNVAYGVENDDIDESRVVEVLAMAQLEEFTQKRDGGINAMVGERGVALSGGQRQRIGIARALYHDPELLVFDESTASLDSSTEKQFLKIIKTLKGKKTILLISHRESTLKNCDSVWKLNGEGLSLVGSTSIATA